MRQFFQDPAIRFGLKLGIAGLLATYLALVLRLDEPTWALFTVFVLMVTPYVGTIVEKSVLRIFGTIVGAVLGYLLLDWQQQPLIMLPVVVGILAFCVAMFGQGLWSYGFFLCGLTIIDVMQAGLADPQMSWRFALTRAEEVVLGILVAVVVQSVVWPRYARDEFDRLRKEIFADLRDLLVPGVEGLFAAEGNAGIQERARKLPARMAKMRTLINFGSNESHDFRSRAPFFEAISDQMEVMALSIVSLAKPLVSSGNPDPELRSQMKALGMSLADALQGLAGDAESNKSQEALRQIRKSHKELEMCVDRAKKRGDFRTESSEYLLSLGHHYQALSELAEAISDVHEKLELIASGRMNEVSPPVSRSLNVPSRFWVQLGIKGGITVAIALVLENWLNPPGGDLLAISAWILLVRGPTAPAGRGDWRAFHSAFFSILAWLFLGFLLLWAHPFLASYAVMNVILFSLLFLWGYLFYGRNPMTTPMLVGMLMIVGVFGLNAQEPVTFQAIVDLVVGMVLAILLSTLVRRTIWPSLPQREILGRLRELSHLVRKTIESNATKLSAGDRGRLALIPVEVSVRAKLLRPPVLDEGTAGRIGEYLQGMHRGAMILSASVKQKARWSETIRMDPAYDQAMAIEKGFRDHLLVHETRLDGEKSSLDPTAELEKMIATKTRTMGDLCQTASSRLSTVEWLGLLAFCKRMEEAGEAFLLVDRTTSQFQWQTLHEDSSL